MGQYPRTSAIERCPYAFLSSTRCTRALALQCFGLRCSSYAQPNRMWLIAELRNELAEHCPLWSALGDPPRGYGGAKPAISEHGADKQVAVLVQHGAHSAACSMVTSRQRSTLYGTPFVSVQADAHGASRLRTPPPLNRSRALALCRTARAPVR